MTEQRVVLPPRTDLKSRRERVAAGVMVRAWVSMSGSCRGCSSTSHLRLTTPCMPCLRTSKRRADPSHGRRPASPSAGGSAWSRGSTYRARRRCRGFDGTGSAGHDPVSRGSSGAIGTRQGRDKFADGPAMRAPRRHPRCRRRDRVAPHDGGDVGATRRLVLLGLRHRPCLRRAQQGGRRVGIWAEDRLTAPTSSARPASRTPRATFPARSLRHARRGSHLAHLQSTGGGQRLRVAYPRKTPPEQGR